MEERKLLVEIKMRQQKLSKGKKRGKKKSRTIFVAFEAENRVYVKYIAKKNRFEAEGASLSKAIDKLLNGMLKKMSATQYQDLYRLEIDYILRELAELGLT